MTFKVTKQSASVYVVGDPYGIGTVYASSRVALVSVEKSIKKYHVTGLYAEQQRSAASNGRWMRADLLPGPNQEFTWTPAAKKVRAWVLQHLEEAKALYLTETGGSST